MFASLPSASQRSSPLKISKNYSSSSSRRSSLESQASTWDFVKESFKEEDLNLNKTAAAQLGYQVLENTIKVIMDLPEKETMVIGTEELTKADIIKKFWADEQFAFNMAEELDKTVKKFLFRTGYRKARRKRKRNNAGGS